MPLSPTATVGEIVASDYRAAAVFQRFGIDFCCGGGATLDAACAKADVPLVRLTAELESLPSAADSTPRPFNTWDLSTLIDFIVTTHHRYVRGTLPVMQAHAHKVAQVHGERHPEAIPIARLVDDLRSEMEAHMMKEEHVLFPYIAAMEEAARSGRALPNAPFGEVRFPIAMMESEHEHAGGAMAQIRALSSDFTPPADACTTFRVCYEELRDFERDLHQHVHLENNILHPKALALEAELDAR